MRAKSKDRRRWADDQGVWDIQRQVSYVRFIQVQDETILLRHLGSLAVRLLELRCLLGTANNFIPP